MNNEKHVTCRNCDNFLVCCFQKFGDETEYAKMEDDKLEAEFRKIAKECNEFDIIASLADNAMKEMNDEKKNSRRNRQ